MAVSLEKSANQLSPASAAKHEAIVCAAARVFMSMGYGAASMDLIASEAGVSKQTVYSHFGAKEALFEEIVSSKCKELMRANGGHVMRDAPPELMLFETARLFLTLVLSKESITLYRTILSECERFPELAQAFYRAGPKSAMESLAADLDVLASQGKLKIEDPKAAAGLFFAMLRGDLHMQCILALRELPGPDEISEKARAATDVFIRAHRPD
ncbi:TetR/AcrR family transcriptional regulator [Thalassospiraceae bacterium LMO-JJ14]|nr:TetR/AcrR family transcriptional regulator [Thalassospiraceae bacterium LMO-JJ14]